MDNETKTKIGYKIVIEDNSRFLSIISTSCSSVILNSEQMFYLKDYSIEYFLNCWVERRKMDGPLSCFSTLERAREFFNSLSNSYHFKLFLCKYIPKDFDTIYQYKLFVRDSKTNRKLFSFESLPSGTCMAESIKLIRCVLSKERG